MRDPARIPRVTEKLVTYWQRHPDTRLGQMIVNLTNREDPFYVEDDTLEDALDRELSK